MQKYTEIDSSTFISASRSKLLDNIKTVMSSSSGKKFPVDNTQVGMLCYRTDKRCLYLLEDSWLKMLEFTKDGNAVVSSAESDNLGQNIAKNYIKSISASGSKLTITKGDGTTGTVNIGSVSYAETAGSAPASDVYSWAKSKNKPTYSWGEINEKPTKLSDFTNDTGFIKASGTCAVAKKANVAESINGGTVTVTVCTVSDTLNIPGGKIWIA